MFESPNLREDAQKARESAIERDISLMQVITKEATEEEKGEGKEDEKVSLYHALLEDPNALTLSTDEVHAAKSKLMAINEAFPDLLMTLSGKTMEIAREELLAAYDKIDSLENT